MKMADNACACSGQMKKKESRDDQLAFQVRLNNNDIKMSVDQKLKEAQNESTDERGRYDVSLGHTAN